MTGAPPIETQGRTPADSINAPPVEGNETLLRIIRHPTWLQRDETGKPVRVSSVAFKDRTSESRAVSVFRAQLIDSDSRPGIVGDAKEAAAVICSEARGLGHTVEPDTRDNQHVSHALIIPPTTASKPWERAAKALAETATIVLLASGG